MGVPNLVEAEAALKRVDRKYPDQFVAVHGGEVVAASPDLESLLEQLAARSLRVQSVSARFVASNRYRYLL